ncbi:MAG TPA: hypothetical protein VM656_13305, partial [Pyrinomonadaceae bacterium]|nr:hypothetical protein [Pyrinomonadaceae bacterium]
NHTVSPRFILRFPCKQDLQSGRLNVDSFIRPNRLFTVDHAVIIYSVAKVKSSKLDETLAKIRQLFS